MSGDCLFCRIAAGELDADIVFENDHVVGFSDLHPQAPTHVLFIPRHHYATLNDASRETAQEFGELLVAAAEFADRIGVAEEGYRVVMNCNAKGGQTVFHVHLHFLAGRALSWPPG